MQLADSEIVGVIDADLSHPPGEDSGIGCAYYQRGGGFYSGEQIYRPRRALRDWPLKRRLSSKIATLAVLGLTKVKDPMSGFFFLKKDIIKNVELSPKGFKIGLEILVRGNSEKGD